MNLLFSFRMLFFQAEDTHDQDFTKPHETLTLL
jgi:hypothetical protein